MKTSANADFRMLSVLHSREFSRTTTLRFCLLAAEYKISSVESNKSDIRLVVVSFHNHDALRCTTNATMS
jgi:hypothetical protein